MVTGDEEHYEDDGLVENGDDAWQFDATQDNTEYFDNERRLKRARSDEPDDRMDDSESDGKMSGDLEIIKMSEDGFELLKKSQLEDIIYYPDVIPLDKLCNRIINTPQFQRLQHIKQLGACHFMFRSATHTRFQHAVGVAYLAEQFVYKLVKNNRSLQGKVDWRDVLCVKVAGLCHDLGHGPFSHAFDDVFMERLKSERSNGHGNGHGNGTMSGEDDEVKPWKHEEMSCLMLEHLLKDNGINLLEYGLVLPEDMTFIKECILGTEPAQRKSKREDVKTFLYDIVNNARSGMDVDKMDYFKRDSHNCAPARGPMWTTQRIFDEARILRAPGKEGFDVEEKPHQICFPTTCVRDASRWFETRSEMHRLVYTHSVVKAAELMIVDVLMLMSEVPLLWVGVEEARRFLGEAAGSSGWVTIVQAARRVEWLARMTDSVVDLIRNIGDRELSEQDRENHGKACELLERLGRRDLYECIGKCKLPGTWLEKAKAEAGQANGGPILTKQLIEQFRRDACKGILQTLRQSLIARLAGTDQAFGEGGARAEPEMDVTEEDMYVEITSIHWGRKCEDPVQSLRFYDSKYKGCPNNYVAGFAKPEDYGFSIHEYEVNRIRVFCKDRSKADRLKAAYAVWRDGLKANEDTTGEPQEEAD